MLIAIDPGSSKSAFVVLDGLKIVVAGKVPNAELIQRLEQDGMPNALAIEFPRVRGMSFQQQVLDTCLLLAGSSKRGTANGRGSTGHT